MKQKLGSKYMLGLMSKLFDGFNEIAIDQPKGTKSSQRVPQHCCREEDQMTRTGVIGVEWSTNNFRAGLHHGP